VIPLFFISFLFQLFSRFIWRQPFPPLFVFFGPVRTQSYILQSSPGWSPHPDPPPQFPAHTPVGRNDRKGISFSLSLSRSGYPFDSSLFGPLPWNRFFGRYVKPGVCELDRVLLTVLHSGQPPSFFVGCLLLSLFLDPPVLMIGTPSPTVCASLIFTVFFLLPCRGVTSFLFFFPKPTFLEERVGMTDFVPCMAGRRNSVPAPGKTGDRVVCT